MRKTERERERERERLYVQFHTMLSTFATATVAFSYVQLFKCPVDSLFLKSINVLTFLVLL